MGGARLIDRIERFGSVDRLVAAPAADLRRAGLSEAAIAALRHPDGALLEKDLEWLAAEGHDLIPWGDPRYPTLLRNVPSPPAALYVDGDPTLLWGPQVAVIGSRNPTAGGRDNARDFAGELSRNGMTITSGLASGIDSIAHASALDAGGCTVAVLGTGVDRIYPASSQPLAERIRGRGVLVSEFPPGTAAKRSHFPSRNRIISGLSLGVLVIEAGLRSGTLITARMATNQGRDVFALPGSIHNPMAKGCHRLIRDGARLVENVTQILQELQPLAGRLADDLRGEMEAADELDETRVEAYKGEPNGASPDGMLDFGEGGPQLGEDPEYRQLWSCLGYDPKPVDTIIRQTGLTARAVSSMLLMLELRGKVEAHPGGAFARKTRGK